MAQKDRIGLVAGHVISFPYCQLYFLNPSALMFKKEVLWKYCRSHRMIPVQIGASTPHFPFDNPLTESFLSHLVSRNPSPNTFLPLQSTSLGKFWQSQLNCILYISGPRNHSLWPWDTHLKGFRLRERQGPILHPPRPHSIPVLGKE